MTDDKIQLTRRKILFSVGTAGVAGAGAGLGTSALFSDEESFENNSITAGTTNLTVQAAIVARSVALDGDPSSPPGVSIQETVVDGSPGAGLTFADLKPGDKFVLGVDVVVEDNPMYVQLEAQNADDGEGTDTEPEPQPGPDDDTDAVGDGTGDDAGDLDNETLVTIGHDDSDGTANDFTWDTGGLAEPSDPEFGSAGGISLTSFLANLQDGIIYEDSSGVPLGHGADTPAEIGGGDNVTHWLYVRVPTSVGNEIQGDTVSFDLVWNAEQARNNDDPFGTSGGGGTTQINTPASGNTGFGSALDSGSPVVAGEPGVSNDEGRAWILPDSGGSVTQGTKLTASQPGDRVGEAVAVDGNTAVVGAPGTNSGAGEVYIYTKSGGSWSTSPDFALTNADNAGATPSSTPSTFDPGPSRVPFGSVVDIDDDVVVAGARPDQFNLVGYNAFQRSQDPSMSDWVWIDSFVDLQRFSDVATDSGVGLLISQDSTDQVFRVFPTAPRPPFDRFGPGNTSSVAGIPGFGAEGDISSGTVFIGATDKALVYEQTGTQTIDGTTIPKYNDAPTASLSPSSGATGVGFGTESLATEGGAVAVGAPTESGDGVVYLYERTSGSWGQTRRITAPSNASSFGRDLAITSSTLYVGASGSVFTYSI